MCSRWAQSYIRICDKDITHTFYSTLCKSFYSRSLWCSRWKISEERQPHSHSHLSQSWKTDHITTVTQLCSPMNKCRLGVCNIDKRFFLWLCWWHYTIFLSVLIWCRYLYWFRPVVDKLFIFFIFCAVISSQQCFFNLKNYVFPYR